MGQGKNDKQAVNGYSRTNHKGFEAQIHFLLLEHNLNFPAVGIMRKDFPVRKAGIRANEYAQRLLAAKRVSGIGAQDNRFIDSVERPFITMDPILVTAHCNEVVLAVWEHGSVVLGAVAVTVRIKDAIGFHSANEGDIFLKCPVPQGFAGIPAVQLEDDAGICLRQRIQKLDRHVDLGAVFWTAAAQTIAQGKISRADIGTKYLITVYYFRTERSEVIFAMFCGCRCLQRRAKQLASNVLFPSFKLGNNTCFPSRWE